MRRERPHGYDLDEDADDRAFHRRYGQHHKSDAARRGSSSSSYDRPTDDAPRPTTRRRFDDGDGFERRSRYVDRDREPSLSPPSRGSRMRRSQSFSLTRSVSKGFRTERDRPRRDQRSSSWRSSSWKDGRDGEGDLRSPAGNMVSQDQAPTRSKDSHSCDQSRSVGTAPARAEEAHRESCSSSEMEEGELQPEPAEDLVPSIKLESKVCGSQGFGSHIAMGEATYKEANSQTLGDDGCSLEVKEQTNAFNSQRCESRLDENGVTKGNDDTHGDVLLEDMKNVSKDEPSIVEEANETPEQIFSVEIMQEEEVTCASTGKRDINLNIDAEGENDIDLEVMPVGMIDSFDPIEVTNADTVEKKKNATLELVSNGLKINQKDKGKSIVSTFLPSTTEPIEVEDSMEGPSAGGFELFIHPYTNNAEKKNQNVISVGKQNDVKNTFGPLDLSLSLPNVLPDCFSRPADPHRSSGRYDGNLAWALPSTLCTNSDAITTSISFSGSHQFTHNPSCSFNQNSLENYEQSVGSHPFFQGVDQFPKGTVWQCWPSKEPKHKEEAGFLFGRALLDSKGAHHSSHLIDDPHHHSTPYAQPLQPGIPIQVAATLSLGCRGTVSVSELDKDKWLLKNKSNLSQSATKLKQKEDAGLLFLGSQDARSEPADGSKRSLKRERSTDAFFRSEQHDGVHLICNSVVESILSKVFTEPLHTVGRMFQDMTDKSITYLKEAISELVSNTEKHEQLLAMQEALKGRSDMNMETLLCCQRNLLEILVALKTGLSDFLLRAGDVSSSDLSEIYLNMKCCNLACRSILPVDDCDCKICIRKNGFCNACMCLVCSKFDMAANTCSWVGCDFCLHWCHTDCGLRGSHIRNGQSVSVTPGASGAQGMTEMQFYCVACNHPSEMFGFVKEVFKTCAKDWKAETLTKELKYVKSIFSSSGDARGANLHDVADQMLIKLENMADSSEVVSYVMAVFTQRDCNIVGPPGVTLRASRSNVEESKERASSSKDPMQLPSVILDKVPNLVSTEYLPSRHFDHISRQTGDAHLQMCPKQKPVVDELENILRFKLAEAKMYQERADDARRESEGLKGIALAKNAKIEEDYVGQITKLSLAEAEERRRKKFEDLQVLERANSEYFSMKMRMDTEIKDLLFKLEATQRIINNCEGDRG